jgi:hypothetical protein
MGPHVFDSDGNCRPWAFRAHGDFRSGASEHVRSTSAIIGPLIQLAIERSQTFRNVIQTISASDGIVYIEEGACGLGRQSCFVNVTKAGPNRILWVMVNTRGNDCDIMGLIGHELQHTVEVLGDPRVADFAAMYNFYSREADPGRNFPFETTEAKRVGEAVRAEVHQNSRCTKVR